jgi:vitamin K-dependent gamma-carboxylase
VTRSILTAATRPIDIASLAAFRVIFGAVMFLGILRFLATGWIEQMYVEPTWFFSYPGFDWVKPWPAWGMYLHYVVLAVLALAIAAGAFHRVACALFTLGFAYTQLIDVTNYLNHHYLVVLIGVQLALLPANAAWSIDVRRRPALARATIPAWMVWLLRFQIGVVYTFAGLAKLKADWLLHAQPLNIWLVARSETPIVGSLFEDPRTALAMSWAGFLFDSTITLWLSWRRTRLIAFGAVLAFHGATGYLFNIGMFPIIMTSSALIFFSPSWPRVLLRKPVPVIEPVPAKPPSRIVLAVIAIHVTLQIALPLRHFAYPGDVLWNEDGMRFAWHVLVRVKKGSVTFVAVLPDGKRFEVPVHNYLTPRQEREMGGQPDLVLQLAREIGRDLRARGSREVAIYAQTAVSLNGRAPAAMIDPTVNLLEIRDVGARTWVLPAPDEPPPTVRRLR